MCVRSTLAAFTGAVVVFAWTSVSWMFLTWHTLDMKSFQRDGVAVTEAIKQEMSESGLYMLPNHDTNLETSTEKQKEWARKAHQGPLVFISVNKSGQKWDMNVSLGIQFMTQLVIALGAAWLLSMSHITTLWKKGVFVSIAVTSGVFLMQSAHWNWWGFPLMASLVHIADTAIGWFLAGIAIGAFQKRT